MQNVSGSGVMSDVGVRSGVLGFGVYVLGRGFVLDLVYGSGLGFRV